MLLLFLRFLVGNGSAIEDEVPGVCDRMAFMIALKAHFDGKVIVPDEPLALKPNQRIRITIESDDSSGSSMIVFSPFTDLTATLMNGDTWDESVALHIDPLDATPADFVRRPGSAAGQIKMADDFNDTPDDFEQYL